MTGARPVRALIVEDDGRLRDVLQLALELEGFAITTAATATEARAKIDGHEVILVDLGLPDADGDALIRDLAAGPAANTPIFAMSGHVLDEDKMRALLSGAVAFKAKPVDPTGLASEIRRVLDRWATDGKAAIWNESYRRLVQGDGEASPLL